MPENTEVVAADTGEIIDIGAMNDRQLAEASYRQNADLLKAMLDLLGAVGALQQTVEQVRDGVQGKAKDPNAPSTADEIESFKKTITELVGAVRAVPDDTATKVNGEIEATLIRVVGADASADAAG